MYSPSDTPALLKATLAFNKKNTDPKAQIITTLSGAVTGSSALILFFHDGPKRPSSFAPFDNIKPLVSTIKQQAFSAFVSGIPSTIIEVANQRGTFNSLNTKTLTAGFLAAVKNQSDVSFNISLYVY